MRILTVATVMASALVLAGCLSTASSFVESSVPIEQGKYTELASETSGTCLQVQWLFFTFGAAGSPQRRAYGDAVSKISEADAMVAMAVDVEQFAFLSPTLMPLPVLPVFTKTRVTGTPVKLNVQ